MHVVAKRSPRSHETVFKKCWYSKVENNSEMNFWKLELDVKQVLVYRHLVLHCYLECRLLWLSCCLGLPPPQVACWPWYTVSSECLVVLVYHLLRLPCGLGKPSPLGALWSWYTTSSGCLVFLVNLLLWTPPERELWLPCLKSEIFRYS